MGWRREAARRVMLTAAACMLVATACGTRALSRQDARAQEAPTPAATAVGNVAADGTAPAGDSVGSPAVSNSASGAPVNANHSASAGPAAAAFPTPSDGPNRTTPPSTARPPGAAGQPAPPAPSSGAQPGAAATPAPTAPAPGNGGARSPVVVASIGNYGGVAGSTSLPIVQTAQVWVKAINAKSGLNGHEVRLLVYDDGSDPARHRSQLQDAIERKGAIALFAEAEPLTGQCCLDYINSKQIPVIGTSTNEQWAYQSPMYFTQASTGTAAGFAALASAGQQFVPEGKTKLGTVVCVEAQQCTASEKLFADHAASVGLQDVYQGRVSLGQPDFTAQCLAARNAGVEILAPIVDFSSVQRVAASCARQGYHPAWTHVPSGMADRYKDDPNLAGMRGASNVFAYFQDNTPATAEYQQAMRNYGSGITKSVLSAQGWTAGKLLEKAGAALPEPPTSEALLAGLWSIRDDTLGGITQPLTFVKDQVAKPVSCWFNIAINNGAWISPDGFKLQCRPTP